MPQVGTHREDLGRRSKTAPEQADAVQVAQPLTVGHIALAPWYVFDVPGIDEQDPQAAGF